MSLIEQIEAAESKDQLEVLGKEHLSIDVDKRKGVETIRAELLEAAEAKTAEEEGEQMPPAPPQGPATEIAAPKAPDAETAEVKEGYRGRLLKHRKSGRLFPWTAQLTKKRDMQEV